ncbi:metal-sensitive transcriptional regulator [Syntrophomonas erecta]
MVETEKDNRRSILLRLRRIEGQVRGIQRMIEDEANCGEVLNQIAAIRSAINQVGIIVFENHAQDCLQDVLREDKSENDLKEIVQMMGRLIR